MNITNYVSVFILIVICFAGLGAAQGSKTVILVRHAEKDSSPSADQANPPLSAEGKTRAERLKDIAGKYRPGAIYSTDYKRTRETVEPLARKRNKSVVVYDPRKQQDLVNAIMSSKTKRFVIVGHSNTIPQLANLLTKKELFKTLDEVEHSVIWIVRLEDGKLKKAEIKPY